MFRLYAEDERTGQCLGKLASALEDRGDYGRALECYSRQCAVEEALLGPGSVQVAATLCNLANAHIGTGRYAEVLPFFERALAIVEKAVGPGHMECANILVSMANFRREEGEYEAARELLERARALQERHLGKGASETADTMEALAALAEGAGDHRSASDRLELALAARRAIAVETMNEFGVGALATEAAEKALAAGAALARAYHAQARYEDALPLLQEALAQPGAGTSERRALARALAAAGDRRREAGAAAEAAGLYSRALPLLEELEGPESYYDAAGVTVDATKTSAAKSSALLEISRVAMHLAGAIAASAGTGAGAAKKAVQAAEKAAAAQAAAVGDLHPDLAATLYQLGALRDAAGDGDGAAEAYERAFAILDLQEYEGSVAAKKAAAAAANREAAVAARQREKLEAYRTRLAAATSVEADRDRLRAAVRAELAQREAGCATLADLLRALGVKVEGGAAPTQQQVASVGRRCKLKSLYLPMAVERCLWFQLAR